MPQAQYNKPQPQFQYQQQGSAYSQSINKDDMKDAQFAKTKAIDEIDLLGGMSSDDSELEDDKEDNMFTPEGTHFIQSQVQQQPIY